jgi:hypothetical protein
MLTTVKDNHTYNSEMWCYSMAIHIRNETQFVKHYMYRFLKILWGTRGLHTALCSELAETVTASVNVTSATAGTISGTYRTSAQSSLRTEHRDPMQVLAPR